MLIMVTFVPAIQAYQKGDILLRGGYTNIATQSSNGTTVNVGDKGNLTAEYLILSATNGAPRFY